MRRSIAPPAGQRRRLVAEDLKVDRLGPGSHPSPADVDDRFVDEEDSVAAFSDMMEMRRYLEGGVPIPAFEPAGARRDLFFDPLRVRCAVVTCGGLCPGENDVIRSIYLTLRDAYGVRDLLAFYYGYSGMARNPLMPAEPLQDSRIEGIHADGGTILGASRGAPPVEEMVDTLQRLGVDILFTIGGDGTFRGAMAICAEIARRGLPIAVVGLPKTIDNDLLWVERTFGFATAVEEARRAINGAHIEAKGAWNGIGLVKLMGRHSGFIAAHASLANSDVTFCLVPEVEFSLDGEKGFLRTLERRLGRWRHALIVVAEGAGQELIEQESPTEVDASGNVKLADVGMFLKKRIGEYFKARGIANAIKYIDPSYIVRSLPASSVDSELCLMFGQYAVHAAMAGRTNMFVSFWNQRFTHVPFAATAGRRKQIDPRGELWQAVLAATRQPARMYDDTP